MSAERYQKNTASYRYSMDEDQQHKVAYSSDRYTENRDK